MFFLKYNQNMTEIIVGYGGLSSLKSCRNYTFLKRKLLSLYIFLLICNPLTGNKKERNVFDDNSAFF